MLILNSLNLKLFSEFIFRMLILEFWLFFRTLEGSVLSTLQQLISWSSAPDKLVNTTTCDQTFFFYDHEINSLPNLSSVQEAERILSHWMRGHIHPSVRSQTADGTTEDETCGRHSHATNRRSLTVSAREMSRGCEHKTILAVMFHYWSSLTGDLVNVHNNVREKKRVY